MGSGRWRWRWRWSELAICFCLSFCRPVYPRDVAQRADFNKERDAKVARMRVRTMRNDYRRGESVVGRRGRHYVQTDASTPLCWPLFEGRAMDYLSCACVCVGRLQSFNEKSHPKSHLPSRAQSHARIGSDRIRSLKEDDFDRCSPLRRSPRADGRARGVGTSNRTGGPSGRLCLGRSPAAPPVRGRRQTDGSGGGIGSDPRRPRGAQCVNNAVVRYALCVMRWRASGSGAKVSERVRAGTRAAGARPASEQRDPLPAAARDRYK